MMESADHERKAELSATVEIDGDECLTVIGYRKSSLKNIISWLCIICTGGIVGLICYFKPTWYIKATCSKTTAKSSELFLLKDKNNDEHIGMVYDMAEGRPTFASRFRKKAPPENRKNVQLIAPQPQNKVEYMEVDSLKYFDCKCVRYIWNPITSSYEKLYGLLNVRLGFILATGQRGLTEMARRQRLQLFGPNRIVSEIPNAFFILFTEVFVSDFAGRRYIVMTIVILILSALSLRFQVHISKRQKIKLREKMDFSCFVEIEDENGRARSVSSETLVPGDVIHINNETVGAFVPCDAVLVSGSCIVNESTLSGQSIPQRKESVDPSTVELPFDIHLHRHLCLYAGTQILQARIGNDGLTRAVVIRTGFSTDKGILVRNIMFHKKPDFKFERQTTWYLLALTAVASIGMIYSIAIKVSRGDSPSEVIRLSAILLTIVVPPILPIALTLGIVISQNRLKRQHIGCSGPNAINLCGLVNLCCFDKTGTLTVDGLDLKTIMPVTISAKGIPRFQNPDERRYSYYDIRQPVVRAMATCHSLSLSNDTGAGRESLDQQPCGPTKRAGEEKQVGVITLKTRDPVLVGDPLEILMFQCVHWRLVEKMIPSFGNTRFRIVWPDFRLKDQALLKECQLGQLVTLREFPFVEAYQRMGVLAYNTVTNHCEYYEKGTPDAVVSICNLATVPEDLPVRLKHVQSEGYLVIGLAWKSFQNMDLLTASQLSRADVESDLEFIGLVTFENRVKADSSAVIEQLFLANIRTVMLTGDNIHTAISVAKTCGILRPNARVSIVEADDAAVRFVPVQKDTAYASTKIVDYSTDEMPGCAQTVGSSSLALTGETLEKIKRFHPALLPRVILQGSVFAGMMPVHKEHMVAHFQDVQYTVAMCGDGANDCSVLQYSNVTTDAITGRIILCSEKKYLTFADCGIFQPSFRFHRSVAQNDLLVLQIMENGRWSWFLSNRDWRISNRKGQAMRTAHVGISVKESEAAVSADFTCTTLGIACVPMVLREGRCALVTYLGMFFFIETYSMTQFSSTVILYWLGTRFSIWELLYQDLFEATVLAIAMSLAAPCSELSKAPTPSSLMSLPSIFSLVVHIFLIVFTQVIAYASSQTIPCDINPNNSTIFSTNVTSYATSTEAWTFAASPLEGCGLERDAVWVVGILQIVFLSAIFAKGFPFRRPFYENYVHVGMAAVLIVFNLICMLGPTKIITDGFSLQAPRSDYVGHRWALLAICFIYLLLAVFFQKIIVDRLVTGYLLRHERFKFLRTLQRREIEDTLAEQILNSNPSTESFDC